MDYISICKWEKHQHYKDRRPKWIKLEIDIIEEFDADGLPKKFYELPDTAKLTFICLLCLRANYNNKIPYKNDKWLSTRLGIGNVDLKPLVLAGYIVIDTEIVSEPYQECIKKLESGPPESETEREKEKRVRTLFVETSDEVRLSDCLFEKIIKNNPQAKKPNIQVWAKQIDLMLRVDNRKPEDILSVIDWCQEDDFWKLNILSTQKLRQQFDRLWLQMTIKNSTSKDPSFSTKMICSSCKKETNALVGGLCWHCKEAG
jgi:hypothetical protein